MLPGCGGGDGGPAGVHTEYDWLLPSPVGGRCAVGEVITGRRQWRHPGRRLVAAQTVPPGRRHPARCSAAQAVGGGAVGEQHPSGNDGAPSAPSPPLPPLPPEPVAPCRPADAAAVAARAAVGRGGVAIRAVAAVATEAAIAGRARGASDARGACVCDEHELASAPRPPSPPEPPRPPLPPEPPLPPLPPARSRRIRCRRVHRCHRCRRSALPPAPPRRRSNCRYRPGRRRRQRRPFARRRLCHHPGRDRSDSFLRCHWLPCADLARYLPRHRCRGAGRRSAVATECPAAARAAFPIQPALPPRPPVPPAPPLP